MHMAEFPFSIIDLPTGTKMAARIAMIATTTKTSTSVKPPNKLEPNSIIRRLVIFPFANSRFEIAVNVEDAPNPALATSED